MCAVMSVSQVVCFVLLYKFLIFNVSEPGIRRGNEDSRGNETGFVRFLNLLDSP